MPRSISAILPDTELVIGAQPSFGIVCTMSAVVPAGDKAGPKLAVPTW